MFRQFRLLYQILDKRTGSIAGLQTWRPDYQRDKGTLQVSITVHKANGSKHKSQCERQVNQNRASGSDSILTAWRKYELFLKYSLV